MTREDRERRNEERLRRRGERDKGNVLVIDAGAPNPCQCWAVVRRGAGWEEETEPGEHHVAHVVRRTFDPDVKVAYYTTRDAACIEAARRGIKGHGPNVQGSHYVWWVHNQTCTCGHCHHPSVTPPAHL